MDVFVVDVYCSEGGDEAAESSFRDNRDKSELRNDNQTFKSSTPTSNTSGPAALIQFTLHAKLQGRDQAKQKPTRTAPITAGVACV